VVMSPAGLGPENDRWRGPAATVNDRPILSSERMLHVDIWTMTSPICNCRPVVMEADSLMDNNDRSQFFNKFRVSQFYLCFLSVPLWIYKNRTTVARLPA
jgi:hypothetical protein